MSEQNGAKVKIGNPAPPIKGQAVVGQEIVDLSYENGVLIVGDQKITDKYLVLFFYPLDFTFVCPTEILAFQEKFSAFKKIGAEIIGVSVDSPFTHLAWKNTPRKKGGLGNIDFPLLADLNKKGAGDYEINFNAKGLVSGLYLYLLQSEDVTITKKMLLIR